MAYRKKRKTLKAGYAAKKKARQVYRVNIKKPKTTVVRKFANFVGKSTYKAVKSKKRY